MIFQSSAAKAVYVMEPKDKVWLPRGKFNIIKGVRAEFSGPYHIFDSDQAAKTYRWSDEKKQELEEYLVRHPDFGHMVFLKAGQPIPKHLQKALDEVKESGGESEPQFTRCLNFEVIDGNVEQCSNSVVPGTKECELHQPIPIKGMITARQ